MAYVTTAVAAGRGLKALLSRGYSAIKELVGSSALTPAQQTSIARRLNISRFDPSAVMRMAKDNKFATAFVLYEVAGITHPVLQDMMAADPELRAVIEQAHVVNDEVADTTSVSDITRFHDEFESIRLAVAVFGSFDRYIAVKRALSLPHETDTLYVQFRSMAKGIL